VGEGLGFVKVYIVMAEMYQYSDSRHWIVAAHTTRKAAVDHAASALARAKEIDGWRCPACGCNAVFHWQEFTDCGGEHPPDNEHDAAMKEHMWMSEIPDTYEVHEVEVTP
jgi:hypothetical protein